MATRPIPLDAERDKLLEAYVRALLLQCREALDRRDREQAGVDEVAARAVAATKARTEMERALTRLRHLATEWIPADTTEPALSSRADCLAALETAYQELGSAIRRHLTPIPKSLRPAHRRAAPFPLWLRLHRLARQEGYRLQDVAAEVLQQLNHWTPQVAIYRSSLRSRAKTRLSAAHRSALDIAFFDAAHPRRAWTTEQMLVRRMKKAAQRSGQSSRRKG